MPESNYRVALIPGDGIGHEVVPAAVQVLGDAARLYGFALSYESFDWSCERYMNAGAMMPADALDLLSEFDAIFLGAVGRPDVPDHVSLWGLLIPIRRSFQQYVNLRPIRAFPGLPTPLAGHTPDELDVIIVRENSEGEYSETGGRINKATEDETAIQIASFSRKAIQRITRYAADLAAARSGRLASATKSNGIVHTMPFWDEVVRQELGERNDLTVEEFHIDALCAHLVLHPERFDVIVASNLFGDILSDLTAALAGSLGLAPSANLNPERRYPSMFEPVHGSAPDIAGQGLANPIGQIWSGAMMVRHLGHPAAADAIEAAIASVLATGACRTPDIGGTDTTQELAQAISDELSNNVPIALP